MTYQINETQNNTAAAQAAQVVNENTTFGLDTTTLTDLEKEFKTKEKVLQEEAEKIRSESKAKDEKISALNNQIIELTKKQFAPRMERLKVIERDIKDRMSEYALAEERMEVHETNKDRIHMSQRPQILPYPNHTLPVWPHILQGVCERHEGGELRYTQV
jgi:uncharacterized protein (DUF342 family)